MNFRFRMDARTLCVMAGATLALLLLLDIQSLRQTNPRTVSQAVLSCTVQERVVTHELALVDDNGQTRVRLGMNELDAPALSLSDQAGQERALLRLNEDNVPSLRLFDDNGTLREGLGFARGSLTPHLWFYDTIGGIQQMLPGSDVHGVNRSPVSTDYTLNGYQSHWASEAVEDTNELKLPLSDPYVICNSSLHAATMPYHAAAPDNIIVWVRKDYPGCMTIGVKGDTPPAGKQWIRVK